MTESEPVTLQEFARRAKFKPGYVRQLKMAGRLVMADDGMRVLPWASMRRIEETSNNPIPRPAPPAEASFSDFAAYARFKPSYITELKRAGRLVLTEDGRRVRVLESMQLIEDTKDPSKIGVQQRHATIRNAAPTSPSPSGDEGQDATDAPPSTFSPSDPHAKRRAKALADQAEAAARKALRDEQVELGELIQREDVERVLADAATRLRTTLENVPATLAPELAATTDEARCRVLLANAIEHALEDLSRKFATAGKTA